VTTLDWAILAGLNLIVFSYAAWRARQTTTGEEWFVGGRALPFWVVGLSMFATSADGGEYVSVNGQTYEYGIAIIAGLMLGAVIGAIVSSFWVAPRMYRAGHFTNTEYLETRYGPSARVVSVLVQLQYRTSVIGTIAVSLQLVLTRAMDLPPTWAWVLVVALALATAAYAAWGGLKTVAATDVLLSAIMVTGMVVLWVVMWQKIGGWEGMERLLHEPAAGRPPARAGQPTDDVLHPVVVVLGMICVVTGYFVSNHAQTMKMFGVRSVWDMKMGALMSGGLIAMSFLLGGTLGALARDLDFVPTLAAGQSDQVYPLLLKNLLAPGLLGLVVAGLLAASISTFEGIGAAMAALFTRDLYQRQLVRDASEAHYLAVTRAATMGIVLLSFLYVPLILNAKTMVDFFISITSVFVTPLTVVYLLGMYTRVHRRSWIVGMVAGAVYGIIRMQLADQLPLWLADKYAAYLWSAGITVTVMLAASAVMGWESGEEDLEELKVCESPFGKHVPGWARPEIWAVALLAGVLMIIVLVMW
jgi:SSS family solute:Na+ symporter